MKQVIHPEIKFMVREILNLCFHINEAGEYFAFFEYSGHVSLVSARVTSTDKVPGEWLTDHLNAYLDHNDAKDKLRLIKESLIKFLPENKEVV